MNMHEKAKSVRLVTSDKAADILGTPRFSVVPFYSPSFGGSIIMMDLSTLVPHPRNPRDMSENPGAILALALSIRTAFLRKPLVVKEDGTILKGHIRHAAIEMLVANDPRFLDLTDGKVPVEVVKVSAEDEETLLFDHSDAEQPLQVVGMMNTLVAEFGKLPRPSEFEVMGRHAHLMNLALGFPKEGELLDSEGKPLTDAARMRKLFAKRKLWLQRSNHLARLPSFIFDHWKAWHKKTTTDSFDATTGQLGKLVALFELANEFLPVKSTLRKSIELIDIPQMAQTGVDEAMAKAIRLIEKPADVRGFVVKLPIEYKGKVAAALFREEWERITGTPADEKAKAPKVRTAKEVSDMRASLKETGNESVDRLLAWVLCEVADVSELREAFTA